MNDIDNTQFSISSPRKLQKIGSITYNHIVPLNLQLSTKIFL